MNKIILFCCLFSLGHLVYGQQFSGIYYVPYGEDLGNEYSDKYPVGLKNIRFEHQVLIKNGLILGGFYQKGNFNYSNHNYTIRSHMFGFNFGKYTTHDHNKKHYSGSTLGLLLSNNNYSIQNKFIDGMGTSYTEKKEANRWEFGLSFSYFYILPIYKRLHAIGKAGIILTPQNAYHPLDNSYDGFTELPRFTPIGGYFPILNLDLQIGLFYQWNFKQKSE